MSDIDANAASPRDTQSQLARVWNDGERHLPAFDPESINHYRHMTAYHFALPLVQGRDVLDYGCGAGYGANFLLRRGSPRSLVAADVSADAIAYCHSAYQDLAANFRLVATGEMPLPDGSADVATLFQTLEHVTDDRALLQSLKRVLRPEGVLLITTPNAALWGGDAHHHPENPHHIREYTRPELFALCRSVFAHVREYGVRGSFRVGGIGVGAESSLAFRAVRKLLRLWSRPSYVAPVSLSDFSIDPSRIEEEALDLLFVCSVTG